MLYSPETPHKDTDPQEKYLRMATIEIDEDDFKLIEEALHSQIKRCNNNSVNCLTGYYSAGSVQKAQDWRRKAEVLSELIDRLAIEMS